MLRFLITSLATGLDEVFVVTDAVFPSASDPLARKREVAIFVNRESVSYGYVEQLFNVF